MLDRGAVDVSTLCVWAVKVHTAISPAHSCNIKCDVNIAETSETLPRLRLT